jgi:very-short-patch-repair endonuclease
MNDHDFFLARSRELRKEQAPAEEILWRRLRNRALDGIKFRRQHVVGRFILDFFAPEYGVAIELDGESHGRTQEEDRARDEELAALDVTVIRVWNSMVFEDLECLLENIWRRCDEIRRARQKVDGHPK